MKENSSISPAEICHPAFTRISSAEIPGTEITAYKYRHFETGAILWFLKTVDTHKAFIVAARTPPVNSKGQAHVLEHCVLCGSKQFSAKNIFFNMQQRSVSTYMNALTFSDHTSFPFSTQNTTDFYNLLDVYLDSVLHPNLNVLDFKQEGVRFEVGCHGWALNGVVYNEMKGAMSSSARKLYHAFNEKLFPNSTYGFNSGGSPEEIRTLTHQDIIDFYDEHYSSSNLIFMSYGNIDCFELQEQIHNKLGGRFNSGKVSLPVLEKSFKQPVRINECQTSIASTSEVYHCLGWVFPIIDEALVQWAVRFLSVILMGDSASPLRSFIENFKRGVSPGPINGLNDTERTWSFRCTVQGAEIEHALEFEQGVMGVLQNIVDTGFDQNTLHRALHKFELAARDKTHPAYSFGLDLLFNGLKSELYHGDPMIEWDEAGGLSLLRTKIIENPDWLVSVLRKYFVENNHRVLFSTRLDADADADAEAKERRFIEACSVDFTDEEVAIIKESSSLLAARQRLPDESENLPKVSLADIASEAMPDEAAFKLLSQPLSDNKIYASATNGVAHLKLYFPVTGFDASIVRAVSALVGRVGTTCEGRSEFMRTLSGTTSGIKVDREVINTELGESLVLSLSTTSLSQNAAKALTVLRQSLQNLDVTDNASINSLLNEHEIAGRNAVISNGHLYALRLASKGISEYCAVDERYNGITSLRKFSSALRQIADDESYKKIFDADLYSLLYNLRHVDCKAFVVQDQAIESSFDSILKTESSQGYVERTCSSVGADNVEESADSKHCAVIVNASTNSCAVVYRTVGLGHQDAAALMVLGPYLQALYLHPDIREKGGAYGAGASYDPRACTFQLFSIRDKQAAATFDAFESSITRLISEEHDQDVLSQSIIRCIAYLDRPKNYLEAARIDFNSYFSGVSSNLLKATRDALLGVAIIDLRRVANKYMQSDMARKSAIATDQSKVELEMRGFDIEYI